MLIFVNLNNPNLWSTYFFSEDRHTESIVWGLCSTT